MVNEAPHRESREQLKIIASLLSSFLAKQQFEQEVQKQLAHLTSFTAPTNILRFLHRGDARGYQIAEMVFTPQTDLSAMLSHLRAKNLINGNCCATDWRNVRFMLTHIGTECVRRLQARDSKIA
jgi:DNA-binding MarR family transcriptional regulator